MILWQHLRLSRFDCCGQWSQEPSLAGAVKFPQKPRELQLVSSVAEPCPTLRLPHGLQPSRLLCPWDSPGKCTGVGCHALLQRIFLTQGSNPGLLHLLHWQAGSLPLVSHLFMNGLNIRSSLDDKCWRVSEPSRIITMCLHFDAI